jgi:hypothetical protein
LLLCGTKSYSFVHNFSTKFCLIFLLNFLHKPVIKFFQNTFRRNSDFVKLPPAAAAVVVCVGSEAEQVVADVGVQSGLAFAVAALGQ